MYPLNAPLLEFSGGLHALVCGLFIENGDDPRPVFNASTVFVIPFIMVRLFMFVVSNSADIL